MRNWINCFLVVLLTIGIVSGCSQQKAPSNKVVLWHWMTDRHDAISQLAAEYSKANNITVEVELFAPSDAYSQKIIAAAQANVLPDIYGILDKKSMVADFIKANYVADLTPALTANNNEWKNTFFEKALADKAFDPNNVYDVMPGYYGIPIDVTTEQMLYNKKLLAKAGIQNPPKTFDEFLKAVDALNRVGITPFVSGWGELWLADCFASNYAFNIMGEEKIMATFRGQVKYTDSDWIKVFEVFRTLRDRKALMDGIVTKGNKFAEQDFALERAAFTFNGSWAVNVYRDMNPNLDFGVMLPPAISNAFPLKIWGGAGSSFVVNAQSPNKDKAIAFLQWLTNKENQAFLSSQTHNLPANREASGDLSPVLADFAKGMDHSTHPSIWAINEDPLVVEVFDKGLQAIIIGDKTPMQVAKEVQAIKERQMAKARK